MKKCDRFRIYYNLHNHKWSIRHGCGLVIGHADGVVMTDVSPVVSEAGRQRVMEEKRKNVHAFLEGKVVSVLGFVPYKGREEPPYHAGMVLESFVEEFRPISYNPYKRGEFYYTDTDEPYLGSFYAFLDSSRKVTVAGARA